MCSYGGHQRQPATSKAFRYAYVAATAGQQLAGRSTQKGQANRLSARRGGQRAPVAWLLTSCSTLQTRPARPSSHFQTLQACRGPPRPSTPFLSASSPAVPPSAGPGRTRPRTLQHASPPSGTRRTLSLRSRLALHTACVQPVVATRLSVPLAFLGANTHTTPTQANTTLTPGARVTADSDPNTGSC